MKIAAYIGDDQERFDELVQLFLSSEYRVTQRASWVLSYCVEAHPVLVKSHLKKLILNLNRPVHDAVKRNTLRFLQCIDIPSSLMGHTADISFRLLTDRKEAVAIKAFAMTVLYRISLKEPDLQRELKLAIEEQLEFESPAFVSRGKKIIAALAQSRS